MGIVFANRHAVVFGGEVGQGDHFEAFAAVVFDVVGDNGVVQNACVHAAVFHFFGEQAHVVKADYLLAGRPEDFLRGVIACVARYHADFVQFFQIFHLGHIFAGRHQNHLGDLVIRLAKRHGGFAFVGDGDT